MRLPRYRCWNLARVIAWIPALGFVAISVWHHLTVEESRDPTAVDLAEFFGNVIMGFAVVHILCALVLLWRNSYATGIIIALLTMPALMLVLVYPPMVLFIVTPYGLVYGAGVATLIGLLIAHEVGEQRRRATTAAAIS